MLAIYITFLILIVLMATIMVMTNNRLAKGPKKTKEETELRYARMYEDTTQTYHGKGVLCTHEEFMEYLTRWNEADSIVDKFSYIESSHIIGQRPVWVK